VNSYLYLFAYFICIKYSMQVLE